MKKRIIISLITLSLILSLLLPVNALSQTESASDEGIVVDYISTGFNRRTWTFPYSDDYFKKSSHKYQHELAKASLGFAVSADRDGTLPLARQGDSVHQYLSNCGFDNILSDSFTRPSTADEYTCAIGSKKIDDFTLIAVVSCGAGYGKEWASNVKIGAGTRHLGFDETAQKIEAEVDRYISDNNITGSIKIWTTGFSRAAALSNIIAADYTKDSPYEVFCYTFATPRTTTEPVAYDNIFNILGKNDPITQLPLASWGFERYGIDKYLTSQEHNSEFIQVVYDASAVSRKLMGDGFFNNPELDIDIMNLISHLSESIPSRELFEKTYENILFDLIDKGKIDDLEDFIHAITDATYEQLSFTNANDLNTMNFLLGIMSKYFDGNTHQILDGSWNPDFSLSGNIAHEHCEDVYLCYLFTDEPEKIYPKGQETLLTYIEGDVDVEIYTQNYLCEIIDRNGKLFSNGNLPDAIVPFGYITEKAPVIHALRMNNITTLAIPLDQKYVIILTSHEDGEISIRTSVNSTTQTANHNATQYTVAVANGSRSVLSAYTLTDGSVILTSDDITRIDTIGDDTEDKAFIIRLETSNFAKLRFTTILFIAMLIPLLFILFHVLVTVAFIRRRKLGKQNTLGIRLTASAISLFLQIMMDCLLLSFLRVTHPICIGVVAFTVLLIVRLIYLIVKRPKDTVIKEILNPLKDEK